MKRRDFLRLLGGVAALPMVGPLSELPMAPDRSPIPRAGLRLPVRRQRRAQHDRAPRFPLRHLRGQRGPLALPQASLQANAVADPAREPSASTRACEPRDLFTGGKLAVIRTSACCCARRPSSTSRTGPNCRRSCSRTTTCKALAYLPPADAGHRRLGWTPGGPARVGQHGPAVGVDFHGQRRRVPERQLRGRARVNAYGPPNPIVQRMRA